jgi:hypothetical protein
MTRARDLCVGTLDAIVGHLDLIEDVGESGEAPRFALAGGFGPVGVCRTFRQSGLSDADSITVSYISMTVPPIGLDSHMLYAHTPSSSAVPHFTLDSISHGEDFAFHLDLPPRVDPGANLAYLDFAYAGLTDVRAEALAIPGLSTAQISPRQWAIMSAWMLVQRADAAAFDAIFSPVAAYRDHWLSLVASGIPSEVLEGPGADAQERAARDVRNRAAVFSPDVDPVWNQVDRLLGAEMSSRLQELLRTPGAR